MTVFKCKECEIGPCFHQSENASSSGAYSDDELFPLVCPHGCEENTDWQPLPCVCRNTRFGKEMQEWISGEGWDIMPEDIRDAICSGGLNARGVNAEKAVRALRMLEDYDEGHLWGNDLEEWKKEFSKISKIDILNAIFPTAFQAGIIYAEMLRHKITTQIKGQDDDSN